jgi:hypothetical protein
MPVVIYNEFRKFGTMLLGKISEHLDKYRSIGNIDRFLRGSSSSCKL